MRSQSYDLTEGSTGRYWRLVTVKVAPSSSSSQTDTGAWRSKEGEVRQFHTIPHCPTLSPRPYSSLCTPHLLRRGTVPASTRGGGDW